MCDKTDESKYDLEQKASKNVKEIEDLQKRVVDIKCEYEKFSISFFQNEFLIFNGVKIR